MAPASPLQRARLPHDAANGYSSPQSSKVAAPEPNISDVVLGNFWIKPWFPSFYPEELVGRKCERLYVCQSCFKYSKELMPYLGHRVRWTLESCNRNALTTCGRESANTRTHHRENSYTRRIM